MPCPRRKAVQCKVLGHPAVCGDDAKTPLFSDIGCCGQLAGEWFYAGLCVYTYRARVGLPLGKSVNDISDCHKYPPFKQIHRAGKPHGVILFLVIWSLVRLFAALGNAVPLEDDNNGFEQDL